MAADPRKLLRLGFEITALVVYHTPRWLVSGMRISLYEDRKGNWTLGRHMHVQMKRHMPGVWGRLVEATSTIFGPGSLMGHAIVYRVGITDPPNPDHTAIHGPDGIWIPAVPEDLVVGEIDTFARDRNITSISIPGYWIHKDEGLPLESPPSPGEKIFYHFHGGGYVAETAHPDGVTSRILKDFLRNSSSSSIRRTFAVEYRLSSPGEPGKGSVFPFPAALLDALAGYLYLVKLGFSEENVIAVGDSAGGSLALALTRYLSSNKEQRPKLPKIPGSLVLLSPLTDVSEQFNENPGPQSSLTLNAERDWLVPINSGMIPASAKVFLGGRPEHVELAYRNPYISPASPILLGLTPDSPTRTISFKEFPRVFIDNGAFETFYDQIRRLGDVMVEDLGEEAVMYNEVDGATHDYLTIDWHEPDKTATSKKILKWLE